MFSFSDLLPLPKNYTPRPQTALSRLIWGWSDVWISMNS